MKKDYKEVIPKATLEASAEKRDEILAKLGFEPTSIWWFNKIHNASHDTLVEDSIAKERSYAEHNFNVRDGALSQTSPAVVERIIKFWSDPGDVVLNPMMGRAMYQIMANYLKRNAIGQDLCRGFYDHNVSKIKQRILNSQAMDEDNFKIAREEPNVFLSTLNGLQFDMYYGDSRHLEIHDNSVDLIVTSPAYWDLEDYGPDPRQAGATPSYDQFLVNMQNIYKECYRVLKPNKYAVIIVNDFRKKGEFYCYHCDTIKVLQEVGFRLHDIFIYNLSVHPLQAIFTSQLYRDRHTAKQHEYGIVCKKV